MIDHGPIDFELPATGGKIFKLSQYQRNLLLIYFYPKDNTPGCTTESVQFRDAYRKFLKQDCDIVGISRDSLKSHESFKAKFELPFDLLSDSDETVCQLFDVIKMKNMYGKKVRGIERSTFLLDSEHKVIQEWRGVKVPEHAQTVLDFISNLT